MENSGRYKWIEDKKVTKCADLYALVSRRVRELNNMKDSVEIIEFVEIDGEQLMEDEIEFLEKLERRIQVLIGMIVTDLKKEEGAE